MNRSGITTRTLVCIGAALCAGIVSAQTAYPTKPVKIMVGAAADNGNYGTEEIDIIAPGVALARSRGIAVDGPFPADTIFVRAKNGHYDGIVTMYHDQGQIAMQLMGFERGVTVQGGLPIAVTTPAHGTAYDIAGKGIAHVGATQNAFQLACRMGKYRAASEH